MLMEERSYEEMRTEAMLSYSKIYKDSLAFDLAEIPKEIRIKLLEDDVYLSYVKKEKADLYAKQLKILQEIIDGEHSSMSETSGNAQEMIKALEMRNKLLFADLNIEADDSNSLNIVMIKMGREDFDAMETVDVAILESNSSDNVSLEDEEFVLPDVKPSRRTTKDDD